MPLHLAWSEVALRLVLATLCGGALGFNRGVEGHAAGLRTMILVTLAAAIAMIQANELLPVDGKSSGSFSVLDLMRLPLGILTGVGFIGGGAILKRHDTVSGVTTAATLWIGTVLGLCFGGGQYGLGVVGTGISLIALWPVRALEKHVPRERHGILMVEIGSVAPEAVVALLKESGCHARLKRRRQEETKISCWFDVSWERRDVDVTPTAMLEALGGRFPIYEFTERDGAG